MSSNYKDVYNAMEMSDNDEQGYGSSSESSTHSTEEIAADLKATKQEVGPIQGGGMSHIMAHPCFLPFC